MTPAFAGAGSGRNDSEKSLRREKKKNEKSLKQEKRERQDMFIGFFVLIAFVAFVS